MIMQSIQIAFIWFLVGCFAGYSRGEKIGIGKGYCQAAKDYKK